MTHAISQVLTKSLRDGGSVFVCGNGGSAAQASHFAAELVGRLDRERRGLRCVSLAADTAVLTAVANDDGYDTVFSRQLEALARRGDALLVLTTSGRSANCRRVAQTASTMGVAVCAIVSRQRVGDHFWQRTVCCEIDENDVARIQEETQRLLHRIAREVEAAMFPDAPMVQR